MNRKQSTGEKHKQLLVKTLRTYRPDKVEFIYENLALNKQDGVVVNVMDEMTLSMSPLP